jgi:hypothetical protein
MPEINQYMFNNKELLELLIKQAHVHDGRWILMSNFGCSAGYFGSTADQVAPPGVAIVINQMGIQRAQADTPKEMWLDAAVVNPSSTAKNKD